MFARIGLMLITSFLVAGLVACGDDDSFEHSFTADSEPAVEQDRPAADLDVSTEASEDGAGSASPIGAGSFDRRVIRNGELDLRVTDVPAAVRFVRELAPDYDGYVESSSSRTLSDGEERADLTLEVPSSAFDEVIDSIRNGPHVVRVEQESTSSRDVTEEFVDLQSQLGNLESTERRFVELLEEAHTIDEILRVESEISRTRGQIEQIQGRINYLEQRTSYSRIHVAFLPEEDGGVVVGGQHFTPGETAREAWNASMQFIGMIGNAAVAVAVFFWWGWPLLGILTLIGLYYRRRKQHATKTA